MSKSCLTLENINAAIFSAVPEVEERTKAVFGSCYDFEAGTREEDPGAYLVFEDVVMKLVIDASHDYGYYHRTAITDSKFKVGQRLVAKIGGIPTEAKVRAALDSTGGVKLVVDFRIRADRYDS